jgi:hypothetical protein
MGILTLVGRLFFTALFAVATSFTFNSSYAQAEPLISDNHSTSVLIAENRPKRKGGRKTNRKPVEQMPTGAYQNVSMNSRATGSLASKTSVRGVLGIMPQQPFGESTILFGAGVTMPYSKTVVLDHGGDYFKLGDELLSVSLLRIGGGAAYIVSQSADSLFRVGGRIGLAVWTIASEFIEESSKKTGIGGELRVTYETKLGGLLLGGEIQLPIILPGGSTSDLLAIYGTFGMAL